MLIAEVLLRFYFRPLRRQEVTAKLFRCFVANGVRFKLPTAFPAFAATLAATLATAQNKRPKHR